MFQITVIASGEHRETSAWVCASGILLCCLLSFSQSDPRIPPEVRYKSSYVNPVAKPADFAAAMPWGIAIADTRVSGYKTAQVEIRGMEFSCRVNGKDVVLNDDTGALRGGLYRRFPWFGTDAHDDMPLAHSGDHRAVILRVGNRTDRVWHFWAASPRRMIPAGDLEGCTVKVQARISKGALLQVGFDYWRNAVIGYGGGGNNHEAGASNWYFPSNEFQEAVFSDLPAAQSAR